MPPEIWPALPVLPEVELRITSAMPPLGPALDGLVETLWQAARTARPLFNGRVFNADRVSPSLIEGHWTEYRRLVAAWADPALFQQLQPRALAVCGLLQCSDGIVLGQRSQAMAYLAGIWQSPPAGSVDQRAAQGNRVDPLIALRHELHEELGLSLDELKARPLCLVEHLGRGVFDLAYALKTNLSFTELTNRHYASGDAEYTTLIAVPADQAEQATGSNLSPATRALLAWNAGQTYSPPVR